jgi:FkbM family methyltransferase
MLWRASIKDENLKILKDIIKSNDVFYDIGGYIGYYSLTAVKNNRNIQVYTFEPNHRSYTEIQRNVMALGYENIDVINIALSDVNRKEIFYVSSRSARSSLYTDWAKRESAQIEASYEVICFKIDTLVRIGRIMPPKVIKLDAEGNELKILDGAIDTIKQYKPSLLIECHNNRKKLIEWFSKLGYKYQNVIKHKTEYGYALWFTPEN